GSWPTGTASSTPQRRGEACLALYEAAQSGTLPAHRSRLGRSVAKALARTAVRVTAQSTSALTSVSYLSHSNQSTISSRGNRNEIVGSNTCSHHAFLIASSSPGRPGEKKAAVSVI